MEVAYVKIFDFLQNLFVKNGVAPYDEANRGMLVEYCKHNSPDGEIIFLAANPNTRQKELAVCAARIRRTRKRQKSIFIYRQCLYIPVLEHRGFELAQEKDITLKIGNKEVALRCLFI